MPLACTKCNGTGFYSYDHNHRAVYDVCCNHDKGWWVLTKYYAGYIEDTDNKCCLAGCGAMRRDLSSKLRKLVT